MLRTTAANPDKMLGPVLEDDARYLCVGFK